MKNVLKLGLVAVSLILTVSAFAAGCCAKRCEVKRCEAPCKLPAPKCAEVTVNYSCDSAPRYEWVCEKRYLPCPMKQSTSTRRVMEECVGVVTPNESKDNAKAAGAGYGVEKGYASKPAKRKMKKNYSF